MALALETGSFGINIDNWDTLDLICQIFASDNLFSRVLFVRSPSKVCKKL